MTRFAPVYYLLVATALVGGLVSNSSAQARTGPAPVELGTRVGATSTLLGSRTGFGGSVTWHLNRWIALEGDVTMVKPADLGLWSGRATLYQAGLRGRLIRTRSGTDWFWTVGGTGGAFESRFDAPGLSWLSGWLGDSSRTDRYHLIPVLPTVGTGIVVPIGSHVGVRADARLLVTPLAIATQTSVGVTVPIGRFGSRN